MHPQELLAGSCGRLALHQITDQPRGDELIFDRVQAIANGKHVVTANKALLAVHGNEIFAAAQAKGVMVAFEAAVAGGIPIIKALREGLTANRIEWIAGIINGTTNFILSEMRDKGLSFDTVLKEAQRLGYAEADPTFDIEGVDAAHKATIMVWAGFPLGTLVVNCVGGLLIGVALVWFDRVPNEALRLLCVTGFLGGLTTFSSFSGESLVLLHRGQFALALGHTAAHLLGSLACAALGYWIIAR